MSTPLYHRIPKTCHTSSFTDHFLWIHSGGSANRPASVALGSLSGAAWASGLFGGLQPIFQQPCYGCVFISEGDCPASASGEARQPRALTCLTLLCSKDLGVKGAEQHEERVRVRGGSSPETGGTGKPRLLAQEALGVWPEALQAPSPKVCW